MRSAGRLVPRFIDAGHEVVGTHHSAASAELLRTLGAKPVCSTLLDAAAVRKAVLDAEPEAIVHEATALAEVRFGPQHGQGDRQDQQSANEGDGRTAGGRARGRRAPIRRAERCHLLPVCPRRRTHQDRGRSARPHAAHELPAERRRDGLISSRPSPTSAGSPCATAPSTAPPTTAHSSPFAIGSFRSSATAAASGPGSTSTTPPPPPCSRWDTTVRRSTTSSTTIPLRCASGCQLSPRPWGEAAAALPHLARTASGRRVVVVLSTEARGASNAKAKREPGWTPRHPTWRTGFKTVYSAITVADRPKPHPAPQTGHSSS